MKKVFTTLCVAAITFAASNSVFAERNIQQIYEQCGIGGLLFGNSNPTLAIISNVSFYFPVPSTNYGSGLKHAQR